MANRVVISSLAPHIIVEGPVRSPPRSSHGVVDAATDMSTLVGSGICFSLVMDEQRDLVHEHL
eukprot:5596387-Amphidinium_carterae.1